MVSRIIGALSTLCALLPGAPLLADANLLGNSSFLLGAPVVKSLDGLSIEGPALEIANWELRGPYLQRADGGVDGTPSLWFNNLSSDAKWLKPGPYVFSAHLKSGGPASVLRLSLLSNGRHGVEIFGKTVEAKGEWARFEVAGKVPVPGRYIVRIKRLSGAESAASEAMLERGEKASRYAPAAPVEGLLKATRSVNRIFLPGERVELLAQVANQTKEAQESELELVVENAFFETVATERRTLKLKPDEKTETPFSFQASATGAYRAVMRLKTGGKASLGGMTWIVVPKPAAEGLADKEPPFFGVDSTVSPANIDFALKMGSKWWRSCGMNGNVEMSSWASIEREKGVFHFRDDLVDMLLAAKLNILATILWTPDWASAAPSDAVEKWGFRCRDFADWTRFMDAYSSHFKGRIACYEIWNEAAGSFFNGGSPAEFAEFTKLAVASIRRNDPGAWIAGGASSNPSFSPSWSSALLASGVYKELDYFDSHGPVSNAFREDLRKAGLPDGRVWQTETNPSCNSFHPLCEYGDPKGADPVDKVNQAAIGALGDFGDGSCGRSYYYISNDRVMGMARMDSEDIPMRDFDGAPTPYVAAAAVIAKKLHHMKSKGRAASPEATTAYLFEGDGRSMIALWAPFDQREARVRFDVDLAPEIKVSDLFGVDLKPDADRSFSLRVPLFFEAKEGMASTLTASLRSAKASGILPPSVIARFAKLRRPLPETLRGATLSASGVVCRGMPYFVFATDKGSEALFWLDAPASVKISAGEMPPEFSMKDCFGRPQTPVKSGDSYILPLSLPVPCMLSSSCAPEKLAEWMASLRVEGLSRFALASARFSSGGLSVEALNESAKPLSGRVSALSAPPGFEFEKREIEVGPIEAERILFQTESASVSTFAEELDAGGSAMAFLPLAKIPADGADSARFELSAREPSAKPGSFVFDLKLLRSYRSAAPKKIDGKLDDWALRSGSKISKATLGAEAWKGERDCSGVVYSAWDDLKLYLAVIVKDDVFFRAYKAGTMWQSDCVEFFFNPCPERPFPAKPRQTDRFFQIFAGPAGGGLPAEFHVECGGQFMRNAKLELASSRTGDGYIVEMAIPFSGFQYLGGKRRNYEVLGFDAAINDNDGGVGRSDGADQNRRKLIVNWAGTPDDYKDVSRYGSLILMPENEK